MRDFLELVENLEPLGLLALAKSLGVEISESKKGETIGANECGTIESNKYETIEPDLSSNLDLSCGELSTYRATPDGEKTLHGPRQSDGAQNEHSTMGSVQEHSAANKTLAPRDGIAIISDVVAAYGNLNRSKRRAIKQDLKTIIKRQRHSK